MIGALPRADVRSANGQAHIEYTFGVNGTVVPASADNTCAKSLLLSLVVGHHLDQSGNHELLRIILQPLSYWKCKYPCPAKIQLIQETEKMIFKVC